MGDVKKKIVGIGEILWDIFPAGKVLGGAPANFAYHSSQFGFDGYVVSAVGTDAHGREILDTLSDKRLNHLVESVGHPSGTVQVTLDERGVPRYEICENVAWDNIPFTKQMEQLARSCSAVCFGSLAQRSELSRTTIHRFLDFVPTDAYTIFDINLRQHYFDREVIHHSLLKSNVLKMNDDEVVTVAGLYQMTELSEQEICRQLMKMYDLQIVVETKGSVGSYIFTPDESSYISTPQVKVVDTVGAGDAFTGVFVAALLAGKSLREAHRLAVDVSAYVCGQQGAMPVIPKILNSIHSCQVGGY